MKLPKSKNSPRKKLREEIGRLQYKLLLKERGELCEICQQRIATCRFHILPVGTYPRLEFHSENILISDWNPCHFSWHHSYFKAQRIEERIKELRGADYKERLQKANATAPRLTTVYLRMLLAAYKEMSKCV